MLHTDLRMPVRPPSSAVIDEVRRINLKNPELGIFDFRFVIYVSLMVIAASASLISILSSDRWNGAPARFGTA